MNIREALKALIQGHDLDYSQMHATMHTIMTGEASEAQIGALLAALAIKGESSVEITAAAQVMRELMLKVEVEADHLVDIVGTGGDGANLFNVSTAASFVVAAAGARVAKHGNRGVSSSSGSADLLDAAGLHLDLDARQVAQCIEQIGVGFMFAPVHHKAMRHAVKPRREMGVRTIFNILGPLTNPAGVRRQLIGVYERALAPVVAEAFRQLGSVHTLVVHAEDGLDEISLAAPTHVCELKEGEIREYLITPEALGIARQPLDPLKVDGTQASLALVESALNDEPGPARDMVALNAGAALYVAGRAESLEAGVALARRTLADRGALAKLRELAAFTQRFAADA